MDIKIKSWKTSVGGVLGAIGTPLAAAGEGWVKTLGIMLASAAVLLIGHAARDKKVSSKDEGVK